MQMLPADVYNWNFETQFQAMRGNYFATAIGNLNASTKRFYEKYAACVCTLIFS